MPTVESVNEWIQANVLDSKVWNDAVKKEIAVIQASRNLQRWYPEVELTDEIVSYQAIWELQGLDPVLKYQKQGLKHISEDGDRIEFNTRDKVSPDVRDILGTPLYELEADEPTVILEGGMLI
ncbi:hypothetical protein B4102_3590 [Heyndrickxia sporothermodurans]|uniref:Uncharacterized protein n=1 Tax=Heyndrickxia sporothermodurans TaxID=46224 RepID=A0A150KLH2_9BACI|nr:hypothetical protein [Heyndrickxia sporothermodurans]KYC94369.1 hypothetical protein B4102_3590 [Heyndrickxia sporothermodurans]